MKKITLFFMLTLLVSTLAFSQAPEKINYQAVARSVSGSPITNTPLAIEFEILEGSTLGAIVYSESQLKTTNQFGLFTAEIGGGTIISGTFAAIDWGSNPHYLRVSINGDIMPATQLLSVPYAMYAKKSEGDLTAGSGLSITGDTIIAISDTSASNEIQTLTINAAKDSIFLSDGGFVEVITGDNWGADSVNTLGNNILGNGTVANPLQVIDNDTSASNR